MRLTRKRNRERWELLESVVESLTVNNRETREKFDAQCRSRWVVVLADTGDEFEDFAGRVTSFHPGDMVSVIDMNGRTHAVPLRKVSEDRGRRFYPGYLQSPDPDTVVQQHPIRRQSKHRKPSAVRTEATKNSE